MSRTVLHHRWAERFAQLLDEADGGRRHHLRSPLDAELTRLVELRRRLIQSAPKVEPDPAFRAELRAVLVATAQREGIGVTAREPDPRERRARRFAIRLTGRGPRARVAVAAGIAVGAVAFAGMSHASGDALPGDALYGLKRSTERAHLALASSDLSRGELYLDFARTRLDEAATMTGALGPVLDDMDHATVSGVRLLTGTAVTERDPAALDLIDRFAATQRELLDQLAGARPAERDRIAASLALLDDVTERSERLQEGLACSLVEAVRHDSLGPLLGECPQSSSPRARSQPPSQQPAPTAPRYPTDSGPAHPAPADLDPSAEPRPVESERPTPSPGVVLLTPGVGEVSPSPTPSAPPPADEPGRRGLLDGLRDLLGSLFGD